MSVKNFWFPPSPEMKKISSSISFYLLRIILPYFIFSWLLLSVILFVQQANRFSDIFFNTVLPSKLIWQLTFALIPNVIAFTCPMAVLVGVIIGLSKMQGDSELVAARAAGTGNFQISMPIIFLGILLSIFAFLINLKGVPFAAGIVRQVALQTALYKLESPIEPGVFNTEINGYTIYVKEGNVRDGTWGKIFIYNEDTKSQLVRLITAESGRIDNTDDKSELILNSAVVSTFSINDETKKFTSDNVGEIRLAIQTKRKELIEKLSKSEETPEELGLTQLIEYAKKQEGKLRTEAQILYARRLLLSFTPLIFAVLGLNLVLRFGRGGRGFGIFLALVSLIFYYLIALFGEQLARTGKISVFLAGLLPVLISLIVISWLYFSNRFFINSFISKINLPFGTERQNKISKGNFYIDLTTGILDSDIVLNIIKYFVFTVLFLSSIYMIFTAFELWRYAGIFQNGFYLLLKYLFYLVPYIYLQLAPSAVMISILATYIIKSRQNEVVIWTAAGQSIYRLLLPCFILMFFIGLLNWGIQEYVAPRANRIQDLLRDQIRNNGNLAKKEGKIWVSRDNKIYSFEKAGQNFENRNINNLTIYEFSEKDFTLESIIKSSSALWLKDKIVFDNGGEKIIWGKNKTSTYEIVERELTVNFDIYNNLNEKPNHLNSIETKNKIQNTTVEIEQKKFEVALLKKYTTPILPLIIMLFTAPFALSLDKTNRVITVGYAVGLWLLFLGIGNAFEQFGVSGFVSPEIAVWSPLAFFSIIGLILMTKIKT
ncbi:MAG: LptF/LptG family permease [Pyrinomonadaceae bacterium]